MISVPLTTFFIIYLAVWLVTVVILWGREQFRLYFNDWSRDKTRVFTCDKCHYNFIEKYTNITRCPRCNDICINRKNHSL